MQFNRRRHPKPGRFIVTQLGSISNNHLSVTCRICGHHSLNSVAKILETRHWSTKLDDIKPKLICRKCRAKGQVTLQIVFIGGSGQAMLGAATKPADTEPG